MHDAINNLANIIRYAHEMGATDVHVADGLAPGVVVRGRIYAMPETQPVTSAEIEVWAKDLCKERIDDLYSEVGAVDGATNLGDLRIRLNFRRQRGGIALTARLLPPDPPDLDELGVPQAIRDVITRPSGLVIVSGPTGAGKSTLLASLIDHVNATEAKHIMTLEEPVEYIHVSRKSQVSQREIPLDVGTFAEGLRSALRARPNIVVVGEMRDQETARAAIDAAFKGQLVLTTSHAGSAAEAVEGLIGLFPSAEQDAAAGRLASVLQLVTVQQLMANSDGGVTPVREVMVNTPAVAQQVRTKQFRSIHNQLGSDRAVGSFTLESDLVAKVESGEVSAEAAMAVANVPEGLTAMLAAREKNRGGAR